LKNLDQRIETGRTHFGRCGSTWDQEIGEFVECDGRLLAVTVRDRTGNFGPLSSRCAKWATFLVSFLITDKDQWPNSCAMGVNW
jgi:hypothetical protein